MKIVPLIEASSSGYEKKYKCPYCELKLTRQKLPPHIDNKHADMIPEGYTALRIAFNTINHKDHGECIICKREAPWNEEKGRYERLCGRQECTDAYKEMARKRNKSVYGTEVPQSDPRYKEEIQKKALAHRKISGKYRFGDGGYVEYTGSYEKKLLEYMDKIMHINSYDIAAPGPSIFYMYEGEEHLYISDFLYIPYNLIIEVKDGGANKNNNQEMRSSREKTIAKEEAVKKDGKYNYLRLTDNDFSQLMEAFAVLKWKLLDEDTDEKYFKVNEFGLVSESYIKNEEDIYYNKDKFDSGEINLCFITGHSGSGKSTMGRDMQNDNIEHYEMDDLQCIKDHFTMENLKEYGDLIYSYFNGPGKRFYVTHKELVDKKVPSSEYEDKLFPGFVHYAMSYAKSHKNKKYVIEGVWLFCTDENGKSWFNPNEFDDYAFYIKGTSSIVSMYRAAKRDAKEDSKDNKNKYLSLFVKNMTKNIKWYIFDEKRIKVFRDYFKNKMKSMNESYIKNEEDIYYNKDKFDSGEINLCFITGHSGSGKSTMGRDMQNDNIEHYEMDDLYCIKDKFTMENLKEYGDLIYSFFNGPGKRFYVTYDELNENKVPESEYEDKIYVEFVHYAMSYAKSHKDKKYVLEGIWFFCDGGNDKPWFTPNEFDDYAFYIKGTSLLISKYRAAKRNANSNRVKNGTKLKRLSVFVKQAFIYNWKYYFLNEKRIKVFRDYFKNKMKSMNESASNITKKEMKESMNATIAAALAPERTPVESDPNNYMMVQHLQNNKMSYGITKDPQCNEFISVSIKDGMQVHKMDKSKIDKVYTVFKMKDKRRAKEVYDEAVNMLRMGAKVDSTDYFYKRYTGHYILTHDQICFDESFELITPFYDNINILAESVEEFIRTDDRLYFAEQTMKEIERFTYER